MCGVVYNQNELTKPKIMPEKFKQYQIQILNYKDQLRDVRVIGLLVFLGVLLLMTWSGIKVIDTNYGLQRQISKLQQQNDVQNLANQNLRLQNQYYGTNQYLDIAARQDFGLAAPGETVWIVPQNVALAHTIDLPNPEQDQAAQTKAKQPAYQRHVQAWVNFLLHRPAVQGK